MQGELGWRGDRQVAWAVANTHPHRELMAIENLQRQGFVTYCPFVRRRRSHARRQDEVLRPLFPGYLFVNVGSEGARWRPILSSYGVRNLVRCGNEPSLIDAQFIDGLKAREVDGAIVRPADRYEVGQHVQITGGAFDGLVAQILAMDEKDRLVVLLDLMNRSVKARVESVHVAPV